MKAESSFEAMLPIVMRAVDSVLRRRGKPKDFADDFRGWVVLKMLEREAAILKQFRGESTQRTQVRLHKPRRSPAGLERPRSGGDVARKCSRRMTA